MSALLIVFSWLFMCLWPLACQLGLSNRAIYTRFDVDRSQNFINLFENFYDDHWRYEEWYGVNGWIADLIDRTMIRYLRFLSMSESANETKVKLFINKTFERMVNRALAHGYILGYISNTYDDFGWREAVLLDLLQFTQEFKDTSLVQYKHQISIVQQRLAFRASYFHRQLEDSWSLEFCNGGAEWQQRPRRNSPWPALYSGEIYKNTITNHLYVSNCVQIYKAWGKRTTPSDLSEIITDKIWWVWQSVRPVFGWKSSPADFRFNDSQLLDRASEGLLWLESANLLSHDSLYVDGQRLQAYQEGSRELPPQFRCNLRNNAVFTYNQLSILRARRGLFLIHGNVQTLYTAHREISNLILATRSGRLGVDGILEEPCEQTGDCDSNMQFFKSATALDLIDMCRPLEDSLSEDAKAYHVSKCLSYAPFVEANTMAAYSFLNDNGEFPYTWNPRLNTTDKGRNLQTQLSGLAIVTANLFFDQPKDRINMG